MQNKVEADVAQLGKLEPKAQQDDADDNVEV